MKNPIKPTFKSEAISLSAVLAIVVASFYFYINFPDQVPTHWNMYGEIDGWSSRFVAAFILPLIILGLYIMFLVLPMLDPKKERYEQFSKVYNVFKGLLVSFMSIIYFVTGFSALGYNIPVAIILPLMIGIMFIIMGNYMSKIKMNWFVGIKTPWTLSSEDVWNKTHRAGGKIFILSGIAIATMNWMPPTWRMPIFIATILLMTFGTFGYSYWLFNKEAKNKKHEGNNN